MGKKCPHCGAALPAEASFCPYCAKSVIERSEPNTPKHIPRKALRIIALLVLAIAVAVGVYFHTRPKTYDSLGEVTYTDKDGTYQVLINVSQDRYNIMTEITQDYGDEERYRFPVRLYINHKDTGADANGIFLQKVKSSSVQIEQPESETPVEAGTPYQEGAYPDAAQVSLIDFFRQSPEESQIVWTLEMENGDTIRLRMDFHIVFREIFNYDSTNADLSDIQGLQNLIDELASSTELNDVVNLYLPPVTYTEQVVLHDRAFNIYGSEENGQRTTFAGGVQLYPLPNRRTWITYFNDIDFVGKDDGTGIGLSCGSRGWAKGCRFMNLKVGALAYGNEMTWINVTNCVFENNEIGLHFNSLDGAPSDERFTENEFTNNTTAVLLENVPTDVQLDFSQTVFTNNGTDIDNRCDQPIRTSEAIFQ